MFELRGVAVGYGGVPVLQNVSFTARAGQITALVGANGCGKTTLLKAVARQLPTLRGTICLHGRDLAAYNRKEFARAAAFMPQVRNIPEIAFAHFPAWHCDEQSVLPFDDFYVVNDKFVIKGDGNNSLHFTFVVYLSNPYVSNVHV